MQPQPAAIEAEPLEELATPGDAIVVHNAHHHNLREIDLSIPRDRLVVVTGPSGSGKSTLAFDVLFAEGQRRYLDTLSPHARQFVKQLEKPAVDRVDGLPPAIAIEQRTTRGGANSTVATMTEVWHLLRLLFSKIGERHCHLCGKRLRAASIERLADDLARRFEGQRVGLLATVVRGRKGFHNKIFTKLAKDGVARARVDGAWIDVKPGHKLDRFKEHTIEALIAEVDPKSKTSAVEDTLRKASRVSGGAVTVVPLGRSAESAEEFTVGAALGCPDCKTGYSEPDPREFSFNSKLGACPQCEGRGYALTFTEHRVVPDPDRSLLDGAIAPLRGEPFGKKAVAVFAKRAQEVANIDPTKPWKKLKERERRAILDGTAELEGILPRLEAELQRGSTSLSAFQDEEACRSCAGSRLRPEARAVRLAGKSIGEIAALSVAESRAWVSALSLGAREQTIAKEVIRALLPKLEFLEQVGLSYLSLDRRGDTLSGGESQRIRLAASLGSALTGVLYVLDEPTIGLHARDNRRLLETLQSLRDRGNTVLVVEHDEETILGADLVVELGPGAGRHGGKITANAPPQVLVKNTSTALGAALAGEGRGRRNPRRWSEPQGWLTLHGARANNLKNITVKFPLGRLTVVCGVSGSGKSTLVRECLWRGTSAALANERMPESILDRIEGASKLQRVSEVDQSPIGRTPRSVPASYVGFLDEIRRLYAATPEARARGYTPSRFSFNVAGGRCEPCGGQGEVTLELSFLPEARIPCDACDGRRFNEETLAVTYRGLNIAQTLALTVTEAHEVFRAVPAVEKPLRLLEEVGLGYLAIGQASNTLSGGEAQRIKLVEEMTRAQEERRTLFVLDEPTTGLSIPDTAKLVEMFHRFVEHGDTLVVIEHNLEVIREADWIVDLGPGGGAGGGRVTAEGPWEKIAAKPAAWKDSATAAEIANDRFRAVRLSKPEKN